MCNKFFFPTHILHLHVRIPRHPHSRRVLICMSLDKSTSYLSLDKRTSYMSLDKRTSYAVIRPKCALRGESFCLVVTLTVHTRTQS